MKKGFYIVAVVLILVATAYTFWSNYDRALGTEGIYPRYVIGDLEEFGKNSGKGNMIALSPYLHTYDFSSKEAFYNMLQYYFSFAQRRKLLNDSTIVVLPEYIGTWLVVANEKRSIYADTSLEDGMKTLVFSNIVKFGSAYLKTTAKDKAKEAVFKMKADEMAEIYQNVFSKLAKDFHVTIVAGSIVLPTPSVKNGKLEIDKSGNLYNVTAVFDVNGNILSPLTKKKFPIEEEKSFTCAAAKEQQPVYKTAAGNLAVLICADAWYPENYKALTDKHVDLLAVPSYVSGNDAWSKKWKGYNGAPTPDDVNKTDIGKISEYEAWIKYAMVVRAMKSNIKTGVNTFLRGDLWNLGSDGHTLIATSKYMKPLNIPFVYEGKDKESGMGSLINVWLE